MKKTNKAAKKRAKKIILPGDFLRATVKPYWNQGQTLLDAQKGIRKKYNITKADINLTWREFEKARRDEEKKIWNEEKTKEKIKRNEEKAKEKLLKEEQKKKEKDKQIKQKYSMPIIPGNIITDKVVQANSFLFEHPYFYNKDRTWWKYVITEFKWTKCDETDLQSDIYGAYRADIIDSRIGQEILKAFKIACRQAIPEDAPESWVQFKDEITDIKTNKKFKANHRWFITNPIPWALGDSEDCPTIDKLFNDWVGPGHKAELYEILAYCLIRKYIVHRIFCFTGFGSNGKGSFLNLLKKFLGEDNLTGGSLTRLNESRFETANLFKKLACLITETSNVTLKDTSMLKALTGEDFITAEYKGKDPFNFTNYAKIIIATNTLPESSDKSDGFYRRWHIIDFPNQFTESDILATIPEHEYNNLALKCLNIACNFIKNPKFTNDGTIQFRRETYEAHSDPIEKFLNECCEKNFDAVTPATKMYQSFLAFLRRNGSNKIDYGGFRSGLMNKGIQFDKKRIIEPVTKNGKTEFKESENPVSVVLGISEKRKSVPDVPDVPGVSTRLPIVNGIEPPAQPAQLAQNPVFTHDSDNEVIE